jgi:hypothetical protein
MAYYDSDYDFEEDVTLTTEQITNEEDFDEMYDNTDIFHDKIKKIVGNDSDLLNICDTTDIMKFLYYQEKDEFVIKTKEEEKHLKDDVVAFEPPENPKNVKYEMNKNCITIINGKIYEKKPEKKVIKKVKSVNIMKKYDWTK